MIFSSAHTDTQDRMVSSTTSITHLCPSWHNIIDIQGVRWGGVEGVEGGISLALPLQSSWDRAFCCRNPLQIINVRPRVSVQIETGGSWIVNSLAARSDIPTAVSSHTEWLKSSLSKLPSAADSHVIYQRAVGGMLRARLLGKVRNFSPITRSRGDRCAT